MITLQSGLTISNQDFSIVLSHPTPSRVIISVPHDGLIANDFNGLFIERVVGVKGRDAHVWPIANDIVQRSLLQGLRIDAVRFLMARMYVDANREMVMEPNLDPDTRGQTAFDDALLCSIYENYRHQLCRLVECSIEVYGSDGVLFLDLHGFCKQPAIAPLEGYDLILGTANRKTIHHGEVDRHFAEWMRTSGHNVFLPEEHPVVPQGDPFSAGHITRWYAEKYGINAMQIEIFSSFRGREDKEKGERLAYEVASFLAKHYS